MLVVSLHSFRTVIPNFYFLQLASLEVPFLYLFQCIIILWWVTGNLGQSGSVLFLSFLQTISNVSSIVCPYSVKMIWCDSACAFYSYLVQKVVGLCFLLIFSTVIIYTKESRRFAERLPVAALDAPIDHISRQPSDVRGHSTVCSHVFHATSGGVLRPGWLRGYAAALPVHCCGVPRRLRQIDW